MRNVLVFRGSPVSWICVFLLLLIEAVMVFFGGPNFQPARSWYECLGLSHEGLLSGNFWQLFTYGFLHGNFLHAGINAVFLLLIGSQLERSIGAAILLKTVMMGVLGGAIGHLLLAPSGLLIGMSGGCMALLLLTTTLSPESRMMPIPLSGKSLGLGVLWGEAIMVLFNPTLEFPGFSRFGGWLVSVGFGAWFQVGHACHLGGGLVGYFMGRWLLRPRISLERLQKDRARREALEKCG